MSGEKAVTIRRWVFAKESLRYKYEVSCVRQMRSPRYGETVRDEVAAVVLYPIRGRREHAQKRGGEDKEDRKSGAQGLRQRCYIPIRKATTTSLLKRLFWPTTEAWLVVIGSHVYDGLASSARDRRDIDTRSIKKLEEIEFSARRPKGFSCGTESSARSRRVRCGTESSARCVAAVRSRVRVARWVSAAV